MSTNPLATPAAASQPASWFGRFGATLRGFLLWRYERGGWQYDVMVGLILAFIFLTPRSWFHDLPLPRMFPTAQLMLVRQAGPATQYRVRASLLAQYGEEPEAAARELLVRFHGQPFILTSIVPVEDDAGAIVWYDVWIRNARE